MSTRRKDRDRLEEPSDRRARPGLKTSNKQYYRKNKKKLNLYSTNYKRSFEGKAVRMWNDIVKRVQKNPSYVRRGIQLKMTRDSFMEFILKDPAYIKYHRLWKISGYKTADSPSPDRIDPDGHYEVSNLRIVPLSVNQKQPKGKRIQN